MQGIAEDQRDGVQQLIREIACGRAVDKTEARKVIQKALVMDRLREVHADVVDIAVRELSEHLPPPFAFTLAKRVNDLDDACNLLNIYTRLYKTGLPSISAALSARSHEILRARKDSAEYQRGWRPLGRVQVPILWTEDQAQQPSASEAPVHDKE